ncbi:hypothetical protein EMIT0P74_120100 [Pseudomonas sp. IT-P74]
MGRLRSFSRGKLLNPFLPALPLMIKLPGWDNVLPLYTLCAVFMDPRFITAGREINWSR